jgi:hypothetical protein
MDTDIDSTGYKLDISHVELWRLESLEACRVRTDCVRVARSAAQSRIRPCSQSQGSQAARIQGAAMRIQGVSDAYPAHSQYIVQRDSPCVSSACAYPARIRRNAQSYRQLPWHFANRSMRSGTLAFPGYCPRHPNSNPGCWPRRPSSIAHFRVYPVRFKWVLCLRDASHGAYRLYFGCV